MTATLVPAITANSSLLERPILHRHMAGLLTEEQEEEDLRAALATLVEKQETLPRLISDVQARVNEHANRLHRKQANVDSMAAIQTDMERGLTKILATYSSRLGLSLTPKDGAIEIGFTQVSRENPDKMYSMNLLIGDDGVYSVQKVPAGCVVCGVFFSFDRLVVDSTICAPC